MEIKAKKKKAKRTRKRKSPAQGSVPDGPVQVPTDRVLCPDMAMMMTTLTMSAGLIVSALMVMKDMDCWAKACFEYTDFGTHAVVSVVTNGVSDDANGCNLDRDTVWLQMCRVGNDFAFHYSTDGTNFYMMRYFTLPADLTMKVGLLAQSPLGDGGKRIYENLSVEKKTVKNIRSGK